jgi:hypothetical protein
MVRCSGGLGGLGIFVVDGERDYGLAGGDYIADVCDGVYASEAPDALEHVGWGHTRGIAACDGVDGRSW